MTAETTGQRAAHLLNDIQDIAFGEIALVVLGTSATIWLVRRLLPYLAERGPSQTRLYLLGAVPLVRLSLLVLAIVWIVPIVFNVTLQNFLVIAGAASVAVGFAFKDYVSSLMAGIVAVFERPYRPGDWVRIGSVYGEVKSVGLRAVRLNTPDDNLVVIPHSLLWTDPITNCSDGVQTMQCVANFYLQPRHDAARVRSALQDVALTSAFLDYGKPIIVVLSEEPWGTHYKLRAYPFDMRDQFQFVSDLTVRGKMAIAEAGASEAVSAAVSPPA